MTGSVATASIVTFSLLAGSTDARACVMAGETQTGATFDWRRPLPVDAGTFTAGFGKREHPILKFVRPHDGIDWTGSIGTSVHAAASGRILEARRNGEFGNHIRIDHGGGWETTYSHLQTIDADALVDACVDAGKAIGRLGNTGLSAGPHLHFELYQNGVAVDPLLHTADGTKHLP